MCIAQNPQVDYATLWFYFHPHFHVWLHWCAAWTVESPDWIRLILFKLWMLWQIFSRWALANQVRSDGCQIVFSEFYFHKIAFVFMCFIFLFEQIFTAIHWYPWKWAKAFATWCNFRTTKNRRREITSKWYEQCNHTDSTATCRKQFTWIQNWTFTGITGENYERNFKHQIEWKWYACTTGKVQKRKSSINANKKINNFLSYLSASIQAKINHEILNSKVFNLENQAYYGGNFKKPQRGTNAGVSRNRFKSSASAKARSKMNIHNNEAGRRVWKVEEKKWNP